jgi:pimeloyl-ACP methyl ester carboxylesterase
MALRGDLDALRDAIPDAEWLDLPRTSHAILLEAGGVIAARLRAFTASL